MTKQRIGLYGGTFNPIHEGHLSLAKQVFEALSLDKLLFIPSGNPPHKENVTDFKHRYAMTQCSLTNTPFEACNIESLHPEVSYTIYTLKHLKKDYPQADFWWLLGEDTLQQLPRWHRIEIFHHYTRLAVTARAGTETISDKLIKKQLPDLYPFIDRIAFTPPQISSSELRKQFKLNINTRPKYLPECAYIYANKHHLYT